MLLQFWKEQDTRNYDVTKSLYGGVEVLLVETRPDRVTRYDLVRLRSKSDVIVDS